MVPAPAGMSPIPMIAPTASPSGPRTCGDEPMLQAQALVDTGGPRTCGDEPTLLLNVPLFGAAAEDRASLRQRVVEKLQTLFDRFYVL